MRLALWLTILAANLGAGELFDAVKSEYLRLFNEQNYGAALEIALQAAEGADAQAQLRRATFMRRFTGTTFARCAITSSPQAAANRKRR